MANDTVLDFRSRFHVPIWSLGPLIIAMAGFFSYLQLNFASASDVQRIENKIDVIYQQAKAQEIQAYMMTICTGGESPAIIRHLQTLQEEYHRLAGRYHPWVCEAPQ